MICKQCGAENAENAKFCNFCGTRMDGLKVCPSCKNEITAESKFCNFCGADLSATDNLAAEPVKATQPDATEPDNKSKTTKYIEAAFSALAALCVLIFVFFISIVTTSTGSSVIGSELSLYDFFGKQYNEFRETLDSLSSSYSAFYEYAGNLKCVLNTIFAVAGLTGVVVFSFIALVKSVRYTLCVTKKGPFPYAAGAVICYIALSCALKFINGTTFSAVSYSSSENAYVTTELSTSLNSSTLVGMVIGVILLMVIVIARIADGETPKSTPADILTLIFACLSTVLAGIVIFTTLTPALSIKQQASTSTYNVYANFSPMYLVSTLSSLTQDEAMVTLMGNTNSVVVFSILSVFCCIAVIVTAGILIIKLLQGNKSKAQIVWAACLVVTAVLYLVFTICAANNFITCQENLAESSSSYSYNDLEFICTTPIAILMISVFTFASVLAEHLIKKQTKKQAA